MTEIESWSKICRFSQSYYEGHPEISDAEFDELYDQFRKDFPNSEFLKLPAKGFNVNSSALQKFTHKYDRVGSLEKIHRTSELDLSGNTKYSLSSKLDGSTMVLYFVNGKFERALTRGDGQTGLDVTNKAVLICDNLNKYFEIAGKPFTGAIRGEVVMSKRNFEKYKQLHPEAKMARNVSTGVLNRKNGFEDDCKYIDYVTYKILANEAVQEGHYDIDYIRNQLEIWGFKVVSRMSCDLKCLTDKLMSEVFELEYFSKYPTDGLVLTENICNIQPNGAIAYNEIAYKFAAETKKCKVVDVKWNFSPKGKLVPVIQIEPTMMSGALVSNVSGFNYKFIMDNNIGPGAVVTVHRSGEVIPDLQEVLVPSAEVTSPYICPECDELLEVTKTGVDLICSNPDCKGRQFYNRYTFIEKMAEDIKGFGEVLIQQLVDVMTEHSPIPEAYTEASLFFDIQHASDDFFHSVFTPANAEKCIKLKTLFQLPLNKEKFLRAMNIDLLGEVAAKQISTNKNLFDTILYYDKSQLPAQLSCLGVAPVLTNNIIKNISRIRSFSTLNVIWEESKSEKISKFIAVTGSLSIPRKEFEVKLNTKGYGITDNMKKAEYLITNDVNSGSSKNKKAKELGIPVVTEEEFWRQIGNRNNYTN